MRTVMRSIITYLLCAVILAASWAYVSSADVELSAHSPAEEGGGALFVENVGQWDAAARFGLLGGDGATWIANDGIWVSLLEPAAADPTPAAIGRKQAAPEAHSGINLRLSFVDANPQAQLEPYGAAETRVSFFYGNDPEGWHADVPVWTGVRYTELYPGLDLDISATSTGWTWRLVAREGLTPAELPALLKAVKLRVEGADRLLPEGGWINAQAQALQVRLPLLRVTDAGGVALSLTTHPELLSKDTVATPFVADEGGFGPTQADLSLRYSTLLGGNVDDYGFSIAVDGAGRACVAGRTASADFPTTPGAFNGRPVRQTDIFVSLLTPDGSGLVYSTHIGGCCWDDVGDIVLDASGRAYLTGRTESPDYPTTPGAFDTVYDGPDAVVTVLNATGTALVYSTYLGGSDWDGGLGIALDGQGLANVTGWTYSWNYPTTANALDASHGGDADIFVTKLNAEGTGLVYSTLLGGDGYDEACAIAVDRLGRIYLAGWTSSSDYVTTTGAYSTVPKGPTDGFVSVLRPAGTSLLYSTYLGGSSLDEVCSIAVDDAGRAYVTGWTYSADYPSTAGAYNTTHNGDSDAFVTVINPSGRGLIYSTFLGGTQYDRAYGLTLDSAGRAYVTGWTFSSDYPTTPDALDRTKDGDSAAFLSVLDAAGSTLEYSTYLDGSGNDEGHGVAVDALGRVYVVGYTTSSDFPTTPGAFSRTQSNGDAFVTVLQGSEDSTHFAPATKWSGGLKYWAPQNRYPRMTGDVNGDGLDDVVVFHPDLGAHVALSTGTALLRPEQWSPEFNWLQGMYNWRALGDVNGDGMADVVAFQYGEGVQVALSTGSSFAPATEWLHDLQTWGPQMVYPRMVGDVNGDGKADIVAIHPANGVFVALSNGTSFETPTDWSSETGWMSDDRSWVALGDVNGDGTVDLVNFRYGEGVYVALSDGTSFGARTVWLSGLLWWGPDQRSPRLVGDVTGDGLADIVAYDPERGGFVGVSTGTSFVRPVQWTSDFAMRRNNYNLHALGDMNGDGRADALCFIYEDGVYVGLSSQ